MIFSTLKPKVTIHNHTDHRLEIKEQGDVTEVTINARQKKNILRTDPTRTGLLRKRFVADINRRFQQLWNLIKDKLEKQDALSLEKFDISLASDRINNFNQWLRQQIETHLLHDGWTTRYIERAYARGQEKAARASKVSISQIQSPALLPVVNARRLTRRRPSPSAFDKARVLARESLEGLRGISSTMASRMSRVVARGVTEGKGVREISRQLYDQFNISKGRARVLARTEVIRGHAEGQLDTFERLGVEELEMEVEWSTAQDERVCPECEEMEGKTFTLDEARGMIPLHPNCRCAWTTATRTRRRRR